MPPNSYRKLFCLISILFISACGGGGGSTSTPPAGSGLPPSGGTPTTPSYLVKPTYSGSTAITTVASYDVAELSYDLTSALDFLNSLAFDTSDSSLPIYPVVAAGKSTENCDSGNITTEELSPNQRFKITYNSCVFGLLQIDGQIELIGTEYSTNDIISSDTLLDLILTDRGTSITTSVNGYIQHTSRSANFTSEAIYYVVLESEGQQIYFDGMEVGEGLLNDGFGFDYSGDVYFSNFGKIVIQTTERYREDSGLRQLMRVTAANVMTLEIKHQDSIVVYYDANSLPLILPLDEIPNAIFGSNNSSPVAVITPNTIATDRNQQVILSSANSYDADYDVLTYNWSVISSPNDSVVSLNNSAQAQFSADLPGDYVIQLRVTDGLSATDTARVTIRVNKDAPSAQIVPLASETFIDDTFEAAVQVSNDTNDGPFDYHLLYGPEGMTVSNDGNIIWDAHLPDFGVTTQVNYAVIVSNPDKSSTVESAVLVKSLATRISQTLADPGDFNFSNLNSLLLKYTNSDGTENGYTYSESNSAPFPIEYSLNSNAIIDSQYIVTELEAGYEYRSKYDIDNDGFAEHLLYKETIIDDPDSTGPVRILISQIWAKSTKDQSLTLLIDNLGYSVGMLKFHDINNDGQNDLLVFDSSDNSFSVYDTTSWQAIYELMNYFRVPEDSVFCDLNQDGIDELITENNVLDITLGLPVHIKEIPGDNTVIHDAEGNCRVFSRSYSSSEIIYENNAYSEIPLTFPVTPVLSAPIVGNFDLDPEEEFLYFTEDNNTYSSRLVKIDIDANGDFISTDLNRPSNLDYVFAQNYMASFDIDGDGIDEMLYREDNPISGIKVHMISINNTELTQSYSSNRLLGSSTNKLTLYEPETNTLKHVISDGYRKHSIVNRRFGVAPEIFDLAEDETPIAAESVAANHYFYTLRNDNSVPESVLKRHDDTANTLWTITDDVTSTLRPEDTFLKSGVLQLSTYNGISRSINTSDGSNLLTLDISQRSTISPSNFGSTFLYSYDLQNVYELNNNMFEIRWGSTNEAWDISSELRSTSIYGIQFMQYDADPQPEAIIYYRDSSASGSRYGYVMRDSLTGDFEALDSSINPYFEQGVFDKYSTIIDCYNFSTTCRNSIQKMGTNQDQFAVIDKLTGKTIWQSPTFAYGYPHIFLSDSNGHITAVNRGTVYK